MTVNQTTRPAINLSASGQRDLLSRRELLWRYGGGLGGIALASLEGRNGFSAGTVPITVTQSHGGVIESLHIPPKATRVVQLFMAGAASHVDLYPTLASALELDSLDGQPQHGINLHAVAREPEKRLPDRAVYLEASGGRMLPRPEQWLTAIRTERYKYVRGLVNDALPEELYDLEADPGERENLLAARPAVVAELRARLVDLVASEARAVPTDATAYSAEEQEVLQDRLRDLGYLE